MSHIKFQRIMLSETSATIFVFISGPCGKENNNQEGAALTKNMQ